MIDLPENPYAVGAVSQINGGISSPLMLMPEVAATLAVAYELSTVNEQLERIARALEGRE